MVIALYFVQNCKETDLCPECGGEMDKETDNSDLNEFSLLSCNECGHEHCGGCV